MLAEAAFLRKGLVNGPFIAQRPVQKGKMIIAGAEFEQLLKAGVALDPAAVIDHIREWPPFARPFAAPRIVDHCMDQLFTGIHICGGEYKDIQSNAAAFNNHPPVYTLLFKLFGVVQVQCKDA